MQRPGRGLAERTEIYGSLAQLYHRATASAEVTDNLIHINSFIKFNWHVCDYNKLTCCERNIDVINKISSRPIVMEAERSEKHGEAKRLLQRFLSGAMGPKLQQAHVMCKQRSKELCLRGK